MKRTPLVRVLDPPLVAAIEGPCIYATKQDFKNLGLGGGNYVLDWEIPGFHDHSLLLAAGYTSIALASC